MRLRQIVKTKTPAWVLMGILGVILMYIGVAGIVSVSAPWQPSSGDTIAHVDYVDRLYNGEIPRFMDGVQYPYFEKTLGREKYQAAAMHPPLFYAIHAPLVGPLLDKGDWHKAIAVGRAINIFFGVVGILVLAWAGWIFGGRNKEYFAIAVPAIGAMIHKFTAINIDYAIEGLLVIFTSLSFIAIYKILKYGPTKKYLAWLTLILVLGMATKVNFIVFFAVSLLAVIISYLLHAKRYNRKVLISGLLASGMIFLVVVLAIGWFYYLWDYKTSGSIFTSKPANLNYISTRPYKSLLDVLSSSNFWSLFYGSFSKSISLSVAMSSFAVAGLLGVSKSRYKKILKNKLIFLSIVLMVLVSFGVMLTQLSHAVGHGSYSFRYILPAILPISLFLAFGLSAVKRTRGMLVPIFSIAMGFSTLWLLPKTGGIRDVYPPSFSGGLVDSILYATSRNDIPAYIPIILMIFFLTGASLLLIVLFKKYRNTFVDDTL